MLIRGGFQWLLTGFWSLDRCLLVLVVGFGDCLGIWFGVCWFGWWVWLMVVWASFGDGCFGGGVQWWLS